MSDNLLKKEFKKSDVQRIRNLITHDFGGSTQNIIGYSRKQEKHKEGDVWEEGGKTWKIEDGLKVSVSKLHKAVELSRLPLLCPKCGKPLNTNLDKKVYPTHKLCYDCVVKMEDELQRRGLYEEYEKNLIQGNIKSFVKDLKARISVMKTDLDTKLVTDEGLVEDWGKTSDTFIKGLEEWEQMLLEKID